MTSLVLASTGREQLTELEQELDKIKNISRENICEGQLACKNMRSSDLGNACNIGLRPKLIMS